MSKITKTIMESLKTMIPDDQAGSVETAINEFVQETENKIKEEYEKTLEESYKDWQKELDEVRNEGSEKLRESEQTALQGYEEARVMLEKKEAELENQKAEFESFLEEQYSVAKSMLDKEISRNNEIERDLYEAYNQQVEDIKEDLVNKIDNFLNDRVEDIAESVRRELKNSPEVLESKVAFDKIKTIVSSSLREEELTESSNRNFSDLQEKVHQLNAELKALKARNMRLTTENRKHVKSLNEANNNPERKEKLDRARREAERKASEKLAENVEGRGTVINKEDLITENAADTTTTESNTNKKSFFSDEEMKKMQFLAGYK